MVRLVVVERFFFINEYALTVNYVRLLKPRNGWTIHLEHAEVGRL